MSDDEFLMACGLTAEYGVRRQTHIGPVDTWYESKSIAVALVLEEGDEAAQLIVHHISHTQVLTAEGWEWSG